jgi:hypothetical protein
MKFKNKIFIIFYLLSALILNGCVQSSASLFGPGITIVKTGNISQGGISYVSNALIVQELKITPTEYIEKILKKVSNENTFVNKATNKSQIKETKLRQTNANNYDDFINAVEKILK